MGVYIPNETMPKDCYTCFCYETEFNMCSLTGKRLDDIRIRQDDCPLIEIDETDTELLEFFNEFKKWENCKEVAKYIRAVYGERRTDDSNT